MTEEFEKTAETTEYELDDDLDVIDEDVDFEYDDENGSADAVDSDVSTAEDTEGDYEAKTEDVEEKPAEVEERKPKGEKNAEQAEKRRNAEREKIRNDAIIEAVGTNPYTGTKITDSVDVEEYLIMKRIADRGGDPVTEYAKELKNSLRARNKTVDEQLRVENERYEHIANHPEDAELFENAQFKRFADKLKGVPMSSIIEAYRVTETANTAAMKNEAARAVAQANANRKASPSSAKGTADTVSASEGLYSLEQLQRMTPAELERNWAKVEKSYDKIHRNLK